LGGRIKISMEQLLQLEQDLQLILDEFESANDNAESTADTTGHDKLAGRVKDFAGNWSKKRDAMAENVAAIQQIITGIDQAWTEVDGQLYESLTDTGQAPAAKAGPRRG